MPWPLDGPRRVSVNCFGFGGTNAHVVLDEAPAYLAVRGLAGHHSSVDGRGAAPPAEPEPRAPVPQLFYFS